MPRVIVVGQGIIGASLAWHLARAGAEVTVADAATAGGIATAASFAWINASGDIPDEYYRLRSRSMELWHDLAHEVPGLPTAFEGGLCFDVGTAKLEELEAIGRGRGYLVRLLSAAEVSERFPALADPPDVALLAEDEGFAEPVQSAKALLDAAKQSGARLLNGTSVTHLLVEKGRVRGVRTAKAIVPADLVVVAAGLGSPAILASAGAALSLDGPPGLLVHTKPTGRYLQGVVMAPGCHFRQTLDGAVVAAEDFGGSDVEDAGAEELTKRVLSRLARHLPDRHFILDRVSVGFRPMPPDGYPMIGDVPGVEGLFLAVMHSGVTLAPVVGRLLAAEMLGADPDVLLAPYRAARLLKSRSAGMSETHRSVPVSE